MKKRIQKPFDAEAAKGGAKIETQDGDSVRILCYDRKSNNNKHINFPIIALTNHNGTESCFSYTSEGRLLDICEDAHDLVIIEEVEVPKFSVGNWLVAYNEDLPRLITAVTDDSYELEDVNGHKVSICHRTIENLCRLWTIKDAKPGDVLIREDGKYPIIFKRSLGSAVFAYCGLSITGSILIDDGRAWTNDTVRPATYKERQQFFKKVEGYGYRWYPESLTLSEIKKRWIDKEDAEVKGYYIHSDSHIVKHSGYNDDINHNIFATEIQAKSALAMARISQIMVNDSRFGGSITDEEWVTNNLKKFTIRRINGRAVFNTDSFVYNFLAFHTAEQRQLFWEENESLIKDYLMIKDNFTLED